MSNENRDNGAIRIQKFLSLAGIASRRHAEELIEQGRVKVSGRVVTEMGVLVVPGKSRVEVDNKPVFYSEERNYILFHKPSNCITTLDDPEKRTTVIDLLPKSLPRVFPVGRLDWDTEGLLLLTNDGDLAYKLMHPNAKVPRVYHAKVRGELKDTSAEFKRLQKGVELEDGLAKPDRVSVIKFTGNNTWIEIELHIGRNRIVRRMCEAIGFPVMKLRRVMFGDLTLDGLPLGAYRDLTEAEVANLYAQLGDVSDVPAVRSKSGVRYARGFDPKERTMPRQAAPTREKLDQEDEIKRSRVNKRPRPSKIAKLDEDAPKRRTPKKFAVTGKKFADREDARFEHDRSRSFASSWATESAGDSRRDERNYRDNDGRRQSRDDSRTERSAFARDERKAFPRDERGDRKAFPRDERSSRKAFPRDERSDRKSFPRDERGNRKSFPRNEHGEPGAFPREGRREALPRDERGDRKAFPKDKRSNRKAFPRDEHSNRSAFPRESDRKSFQRRNDRDAFENDERGDRKTLSRDKHNDRPAVSRDERSNRDDFSKRSHESRSSGRDHGDKKRPFAAKTIKPRRGPRSR